MNTIKENSKAAFNQQAATYDKDIKGQHARSLCRTFRFNLPSIWDAGLVKC